MSAGSLMLHLSVCQLVCFACPSLVFAGHTKLNGAIVYIYLGILGPVPLC
jgi:hypothetical protein